MIVLLMLRSPESKFVAQLRLVSILLSIIVICLGSSVIVGWLFEITLLKSIIIDRLTMKVSTALGFILAGFTLLLWHQRQSNHNWWTSFSLYLLSSMAIAFCLIALIEYSFNLDLGTSWLALPDSPDAVDAIVKGRMSPPTAWGFLLFNIGILLLVQRYYLAAQLLIIGVLVIAFVSLIGHLYDIPLFYSGGSPSGVAIHTAIGFILMALAMLMACSQRGWMRVITRQEAGGIMARWLLPLVVIVPPTLGSLFWLLFRGNTYYFELIIALRIIVEMILFGVLVWWIARKLNQSDRAQQKLFQNLLETERRFRAIFNQTFQFTGLLTPEGILLEANQTALDFAGITMADVVNKPFWQAYWWRIAPETQSRLQQAIALASQGEFIRYPVAVQGANQKIITIDFSLRPVKNEAGEVILLIPEGRDISQQIEIEQALAQSEARYKAIVEEQTELICRYLADGTVLYVNDAYCRYFGLDKEQIIGQQYVPVIYEADRERIEQLVNSLNQNNPTVTIVNRVWAKGKVRWTQWNNRIIGAQMGEMSEYQSVGRDITDLKLIEAKLRESEARFRRAFADAATGEALVALDGKFIKVNRALCEIVGYKEAELLQKTFQEITHPDDLDLDVSYVGQMLTGEIRTYQMEKRYIKSSGNLVWVLLSVSLVKNIEDKPLYFIAQIQNIHQRKYAEAKLTMLLQELERSNQELEEFASVVSHDLISPLRKQNLLIESLQEDYDPILDAEGKDYLAKMMGLNERMKRLIFNLLTYARITTQAKPFSTVALNDVISGVLYDLESEINRIQAQIEIGELPTVMGDHSQLRQLWQNLLQNALKFHASERIPKIKIYQSTSSTDFYQINIADNGIGFEAEQQEKIFIPFHRLYSQSKYEGTGLGLAICDKIIKRHQGKIVARSQPQGGATFMIYLPK